MSHANAILTPNGRLELARLVVDKGWPLRRAAERWNCSVTTARRWAELGDGPIAVRHQEAFTIRNALQIATEILPKLGDSDRFVHVHEGSRCSPGGLRSAGDPEVRSVREVR